MMNTKYYFLGAVDTWSFRGNKAFGDAPGSYGDTTFPPMPSVVAGAFRSMLLGQDPSEIDRFTSGNIPADPALGRILGTLREPGSFQVSLVAPARRMGKVVEPFIHLPSDMVVANKGQQVLRMVPQQLSADCICSVPDSVSTVPILRQQKASKPESGWLLNQDGVLAFQEGNGRSLNRQHLVHSNGLWSEEFRIGIGLHSNSRSSEEGKLFSLRHTSPRHLQENGNDGEVGLLVGLQGCENRMPDLGCLRLGGDGRGATYELIAYNNTFDWYGSELMWKSIESTKKFKLLMQTPGIFAGGWLPDIVEKKENDLILEWSDLRARLVCAIVPRYTVVSGWNLADWKPKTAQRAVPTGSVYWFDSLEGKLDALRNLAEHGLWSHKNDNIDRQRQAEGYNRVVIAAV